MRSADQLSCAAQIEAHPRRFLREIHLGKGRNTVNKKIRYDVVGLGHIAQTAVLPAFKHAGSAFSAYLKKIK
jgi:uncharacterized membrane protein